MKIKLLLIFLLCFASTSYGQTDVDKLDSAAVTIKASQGQGSGSIIIKDVVVDSDGTIEKVAFCLTAAHVIQSHRSVRSVIENGKDIKIIEFSDPGILQELYSKGRRIGELKLDAKVIRYSDADDGDDLALLMLYARNKFDNSVEFIQDKEYIPNKGMRVIHIGSSNGQVGSNSFTAGNISQTGRLLPNVGSGSGVIFDQTSAPAEPGSSGCMIVEEETGKYIGMLVRGGSSTFNFVVPVRRMWKWAEKNNVEFILQDTYPPVILEEILKQPIEIHTTLSSSNNSEHTHDDHNNFLFKYNKTIDTEDSFIINN